MAFYLSASSEFTFSVTDVYGEAYPLEVNVGKQGIPIDRFVVLTVGAVINKSSSELKVLVNVTEIAQRRLPFAWN